MQHSNSWSEEQVIRVSRMSKHFVRRWQQRVGATPSIEAVNQILASSQRIRRQIRCMVPRFGGWVPHKVLAEYWNHGRGLVILVDEDNRMAVTVITAGNGGGRS